MILSNELLPDPGYIINSKGQIGLYFAETSEADETDR
jgi:hypothetical protein